MKLFDVLKETDIIKEATVGELVSGEEEKKRWANMTAKEQAAELRKREEQKPENKDKDKAWFDEWEKNKLETIKKKEENLKAAQRAGGLAKAGTTSISKDRREEAMTKSEDIKKEEGRFFDMDYKEAISEYENASKTERNQIIRRIAREISKDKREANNILSELNKIKDREEIKIVKDAINDLINPEGKGKHSQQSLKKNIEDASKKVDIEFSKAPLKEKAKQIVTSWKGSGKEEEETLNKFIKNGDSKKDAVNIVKNYMPEEIQKVIGKADDEQLKEMAKSLIDLWSKDYIILQKFAKGIKGIEEEQVEKIINDVEEKGRKNFEVILNSINRQMKALDKKDEDEKKKSKDDYGDKAKDSDTSVKSIMDAIEERKTLKNKMYQLFLDKGDTKAAAKEAMKDQPKEEKRRWELMNKKEERTITDEERDELDQLQNEDFNLLFIRKNNFEYLKEGLGYTGVNFDKNYYASIIIKSFISDYNKYGDNIVNFYEDTWGDWDGAFRLAANNIYTLQEEVQSFNNHTLLFEALPDAIKNTVGTSPSLFQRVGMAANRGRLGVMSGSILTRVWDKIKGLGKSFYENRLMPFLKSGFVWAKELATKGIDFFKNISPSVAIPIALGVAGITSIAALKNRKKRKKVEQLLRKNEMALSKLEGENSGLTKYFEQAKKLESLSGNATAKPA